MTILEAMHDPALFGPWFKKHDTWRAWEVFLTALFGLPLCEDDLEVYRRHTGRSTPPSAPAREAWLVVGRRGGKSRIAALVAVYLACFRDYTEHLAPGEVATLPVIAADRKQARVVFKYINGFLDGVPMLKALVVNRTKESIELANRVTIEVHTASFRAVRGYTLLGCVADEIAFWATDDGSANPDTEILNGLRPGMATVPGAMLIAISSPYARRGALWEAYRRHYGQDGDPILIWQASTTSMHPSVDPQVIADAYAEDEAAAAAEYGAEFRRDIESFVSREAVDAVTIFGRHELPPLSGIDYFAFVDPSGGSADSMTLAIAHEMDGRVVLDCVRERKPPFSPADVVTEFAATLSAYGVGSVGGDRYAGEWPRERFSEHDIGYSTANKAKSDLYRELLPLVNSRQVELLDHPRLAAQLCSLERRTARGGRDSIDHPPSGHDDLINAAAGALVRAADADRGWHVVSDADDAAEPTSQIQVSIDESAPAQLRRMLPTMLGDGYGERRCGTCEYFTAGANGVGKCEQLLVNVEAKAYACELYELGAEEDGREAATG